MYAHEQNQLEPKFRVEYLDMCDFPKQLSTVQSITAYVTKGELKRCISKCLFGIMHHHALIIYYMKGNNVVYTYSLSLQSTTLIIIYYTF